MNEPLRIALVIDLFPPIVGGAETHARDLALALVGKGARVTVLTRRARGDLPPVESPAGGLEVVRVGKPGSPRWGKYAFARPLLREWESRAGGFDVACLCGFRVLGWPLAGAAFRSGVPLVLRAEVCGEMSGAFVWERPGRGESALLRVLFRPLVRLRNRRLVRRGVFWAISSAVAGEYRSAGVPAERIRTIPNGVDASRFRPPEPGEKEALRSEFGLGDEPVFLYSGKLNRGKGLQDLLTAWAGLRDEGRKGCLVLLGAGGGQYLSEEGDLRRRVAVEGLGGSVRFTGYRTDVERWLRAADVFVFPSEAESFGLAPLEANASGLPVVSTGAGALAETMPDGQGCLRVPVGDPVFLARAMARLADSPGLRERLGASGRARVIRDYSFEAVAGRSLEWFAELAGERECG